MYRQISRSAGRFFDSGKKETLKKVWARLRSKTYMFYQLRFFNPEASEAMISTQAGIIVGAKTAAQVCTGMLWGRLADSEYGGRKTVLMIGLICSGMSQSKFDQSTKAELFRHLMHWVWVVENIHLCCGVASIWRCYE